MKVSISITDTETQVLFAPECETDKTAIGLLAKLEDAAIVRRTFNVANASTRCNCLLIRLDEVGGAGREATMFDPETNSVLPKD